MTHTLIRQHRLRRVRRFVRRHPRLTAAALLAFGAAIALWALTRPGARFGPVDSTWHRMQVNKDFYVGLDPNYPPFAVWTPEKIDGIEADIARELGRRMGVETSILIMGYDGLYDALYTGNVDLIMAGLRVDPIYADWVHYSAPYYDAGQTLVSSQDHAYRRMDQLDGAIVAVETASLGDLVAQRWQRRLHDLTIQRHLLPEEALHAVAEGDADAALLDTVSARLHRSTFPKLDAAPDTVEPDEYVIAMRDANFRLIEEVERALAGMKADGTLDAILNRWLDSSGPLVQEP